MTLAHIGPVPIEETLATTGPALLMILGALAARFRAHRSRNEHG